MSMRVQDAAHTGNVNRESSDQTLTDTMLRCWRTRDKAVCRTVLLVLLCVQLLGLAANIFWLTSGGKLFLSTDSYSYKTYTLKEYTSRSKLYWADFRLAKGSAKRVRQRPPLIRKTFKKKQEKFVWISPKVTKRVKHIAATFANHGYTVIEYLHTSWKVWWTTSDAFQDDTSSLLHLRPDQKVNHVPGAKALYKKVDLITSGIPVIKPAFRLPQDKAKFAAYVKAHPKVQWLQKNYRHGGVHILEHYHILADSNPTIAQEFISNPFLIDNKKFDIGIFLVVTSASPLKMYLYQGDWLVKFCHKDYEPFNAIDLKKYVEGKIALKTEHMPSLKHLVDLGFTSKQCVKTHLKEKGLDADKVEDDILAAATQVGVAKDLDIYKVAKQLNLTSSTNFFELLRYDFLLDRDLRPWVLELNLSPDLTTISEESRVSSMFRNMADSMVTLVGLQDPEHSDSDRRNQVADSEVDIASDICRVDCHQKCDTWICRACSGCLTSRDREALKQTVLEEKRRGPWHRVVPPRFKDQSTAKAWNPNVDPFYQKMAPQTQFLACWFYHKCLADASWC